MSGELPPGVRRLFPDHRPGAVRAAPSLLIGRLLEDGDTEDLAWLVGELGEDALRRWLTARGGRQLSRRSRAYWRLVLAVEPAPPAPISEQLWPL